MAKRRAAPCRWTRAEFRKHCVRFMGQRRWLMNLLEPKERMQKQASRKQLDHRSAFSVRASVGTQRGNQRARSSGPDAQRSLAQDLLLKSLRKRQRAELIKILLD